MDEKYRLHPEPVTLSEAHHADHIIRSNHIGWQVPSELNTFTYTLAVYPLVVLGFILRSPASWLGLAIGEFLLLR